MNEQQAEDFCLSFFISLFGVVFWLVIPMVTPPLAIVWLIILPFCSLLTFIVIGLGGAIKRSRWVPAGMCVFLLLWALMGLYGKYEATAFITELEEQSTDLNLDGLPPGFITGESTTPWHYPKNHESALLKGLNVFVRHSGGIHRLSMGTGKACDLPKSLRATEQAKRQIPPGKCIRVEKISPKDIHAVEFIRERHEYKEISPKLKNLGGGFPMFRWNYFHWSVVLHRGGVEQTVANGFTGKTQYPFWLPVVYLLPHNPDYGRFGWASLYASESKIGSGWTQHVFIEKLVEAADIPSAMAKKTTPKEKPNRPSLHKSENLESIRKRMTTLAHSAASDDRVAAAKEVKNWIKNGGDLKAIEENLKILLHYRLHYRKYQLYYVLLNSLDTVPDWLATLLITVDPDWTIDDLGLLLLKADPQFISKIEKLYAPMFIKSLDVNNGHISEVQALILLLPLFSDEPLSRIYSQCSIPKFDAIEKLLKHLKTYKENERVSYPREAKQRLIRHVWPCLKARYQTNGRAERTAEVFGGIPTDLAMAGGFVGPERTPQGHLMVTERRLPPRSDKPEAIRKRLTILANSSDPGDRRVAVFEIERWRKAGGKLKDIRPSIETLLKYDFGYKRDSLYMELSKTDESVPDWLATLLITSDPDWSKRELGWALLKAAPHHAKIVEEKHLGQFIKNLDLRNGDFRNMVGIGLLLPRFSDKSLSKIYSNCPRSNFNELVTMFDYFERRRSEKNIIPLYTEEEKTHFSRHVIPCLKVRPNKDYFRLRFEKHFGPIS